MSKTLYSALLLLSAAGCSPDSSLSPAAPTIAAGEVRIIRDQFGTPHIYAAQRYELFYGYGYAVAQDRLFQMEMARRSTQGLVAAVLGEQYADYDENARRGFSPASIRRQLDSLAPRDLDIFRGYAAGINAWLLAIEAQPQRLLPQEFGEFGFAPTAWTAYDVAMIFVGTMANRYGDFNTELENGAILAALSQQHDARTARAIFDDLNPRRSEAAPTTLDAADWPPGDSADSREGADSGEGADSEDSADSAAIDHSAKDYATAAYTAAQFAPGELAASRPISGFSNCFVLGPNKSSGAGAILVNGPQFGWYVPAYVYSVGLHGAGFNMVGNTPFAYPVLLFGHNGSIAWGSTWGAGDIVDIYRESLNPLDASEYRYRGDYRKFEQRRERIEIKNAPARQIVVQRSVHGPIVAVDGANGHAYAKQRSWDGKELQSLLAWLHSTRATRFDDWLQRAEQAALNINWYYADRAGNIGYAFVGHYPQRVRGHDNRLPASGDGSMDWQGRQPFAGQPHVLNPASGFIANWNNKPAAGVLNPDEYWYSWAAADRVDNLHRSIEAQATFTPEQAWQIIEHSSYADINAPYFLDWIRAATAQSADWQLRRAGELLLAWDLQTRDRDGDGFYDAPQTLLFQSFLTQLLRDVLADDLGAAFKWFAASGYPAPGRPSAAGINIATGTKTVVAALRKTSHYDFLNGRTAQEVVGASLSTVLQRLRAARGDNMENWRLAVAPRPYSNKNFLGIPQAGAANRLQAPSEQNRGTENNMMVMNADGIVAWEVTPPGQSGFIDPQGVKNRHYDDQFELYYRFGKKRMWFYPAEVAANRQSETVLQTTSDPHSRGL